VIGPAAQAWILGVAAAVSAVGLSVPTAVAGTASIELPADAVTSAGVFDAHEHLIRTLWSARRMQRGAVVVDWDGLDDDAQAVAPLGPYSARLLAHDVRYVWEGVIGNTSRESTGPTVHRAFHLVYSMSIDERGHAFYVVGYNEQQNGIHRFETSDSQRQAALAHDDYSRVFRYAATDGVLAYFANVGLYAPPGSPAREPTSFVMALRVDDGTEYAFPAGHAEARTGEPGTRWVSVIDRDDEDRTLGEDFARAPSGLAVQRHGSALFVAHRLLDEVRVLDKRSGEPLGRIAVSAPVGLAVAADDSLWVLCQEDGHAAAIHYRLQGANWIASNTIAAQLKAPRAIAVSPLDATVIVADAGTEQVKAFDGRGALKWVLGRAGGFRSGDPEVSSDKLWLSAEPTYLAFQSDGSFWVGDPGNARNLHFSARLQYLGQIMYLPAIYHIAVDSLEPSRVFERYLEFSVDYSAPIERSWRLVRNWGAGLHERYVGDLDGFRSVTTLSNGRTYGVVPRYDLKNTNEILELTRQGLRPTGCLLPLGVKLYADGSLRNQERRPGVLQVYARALSGFDAAGNPQWSEPALLASVEGTRDEDPYNRDAPSMGGGNEATFPQTDGGVIVSFNPGKQAGFHLGGIRRGESAWLWRSSPSGTWNVDQAGQILNRDGTFELDHGVQYAGNLVAAAGRHIIYGYHGEGWNGGQAGQWMHYLDDGLFIGQFGQPVYPGINKRTALPESAGNAFSPQLVTVNGRIYLWTNDESVHAGVQRWRIDGADQIRVLEAPISP
jgi:hypothetical protein